MKKDEIINLDSRCVGCGLCVSICKRKAISLVEDERGFIVRKTDNNICNQCMACEKVCPILNPEQLSVSTPGAYGTHIGRLKSIDPLRLCSSGGAFYAIAQNALDKQYAVIGAALDCKKANVSHIIVRNRMDDSILGSKYVQSSLDNAWVAINSLLANKTKVLFCGTPCQTYALRRAFGETDNLLLVDFPCHGVASRRLFREYIDNLSKRANTKIDSYNFRDKSRGWKSAAIKYAFADGPNVIRNGGDDLFYYLFSENLSINPECINCAFSTKHYGDITIGDFWNYSKVGLSSHDVENGYSIIWVNSARGKEMLRYANGRMIVREIDQTYGSYAFADRSMRSNVSSSEFFKLYLKKGYKAIYKRYFLARHFREAYKRLKRAIHNGK